MSKLNFDGKVVLVTGGSRGLGRAFALKFANLGAKVVINSLGGPDEEQPDLSAAEVTLAAIERAGGEGAVFDCPVAEADKIIEFCRANYGRLDTVVHSAGVTRDQRLMNIDDENWKVVTGTNLDAAFGLSRAAWPLFLEQGAGRLLFIGSSSGLYGNFGQANYSAAKAGLLGLAQTIAIEGAKHNIHANVVAPVGITRMNRHMLPEESHDKLSAERVAPVAAWLCHPECEDNGSVYEVAGGWVGKVRWERSSGVVLPNNNDELDEIAAHWAAASDFSQAIHPTSAMDSLGKILAQLEG